MKNFIIHTNENAYFVKANNMVEAYEKVANYHKDSKEVIISAFCLDVGERDVIKIKSLL